MTRFVLPMGLVCLVLTATAQEAGTLDTYVAEVLNVSRGDVLRVKDGGPERVVLLYGVTCPDPNTPVGGRAKAFTQDAILGQEVRLTVRFQQPSVNYVEIRLEDGRILNHELLLAGLGKLDTVSAATDDAYAALEQKAMDGQAGVWAPVDQTAPTDVVTLDDQTETAVERFKRVKELEAEVQFAVELEHWRALSDAQRAEIRSTLENRVQARAAQAEATLEVIESDFQTVQGELGELERQIDEVEAALDEVSPENEEQAVNELYDNDPDMVRLQARLADATAARIVAERDFGGNSNQFFRYEEDEEIAAELVEERRQQLIIEEQVLRADFAAEREQLAAELQQLEAGYDTLMLDYQDAETEYDRASVGVGTQEARLDAGLSNLAALEQAAQRNFQPRLSSRQIGIWRGRGDSQTPPFDIRNDVWVLDYDAGAAAGRRELSITVRRESDDGVVRQIVDNSLFHQSFVTFNDRGSFYLVIDAPDELSWSITINGYAPR